MRLHKRQQRSPQSDHPRLRGNHISDNNIIDNENIHRVDYDEDDTPYDDPDVLSTPGTLDLDAETDFDLDHDLPAPGPRLSIRGEEIAIILGVMVLWVAAIALFFNRWGKIRMLEPYQPKFCEEHRPSCPISESSMPPLFPRSFSKLNLLTDENPHYAKFIRTNVTGGGAAVGGLAMRTFGIPTGVLTSTTARHVPAARPQRQRQNSLFSPYDTGPTSTYRSYARRTKSAIDLPSLILSEEFFETVRRNSKPIPVSHV